MENCRWILDANTIHLATNWHVESLVHFLGLNPDDADFSKDLIKGTSKFGYTPLHVAAFQNNAAATRFLISKKACTMSQNDKKSNSTALGSQKWIH